MLLRALQDVEAGFYIDIGAFSPELHSVTKAFYERGWHGINIEPNPECQAAFAAQRRRDINLAVAVGDRSGTMQLHVISDTGLSTLDASIAEKHVATGWKSEPHDVPVVTLDDIFKAHVGPQADVHFLKIDVEGFEAQVIRGNDWKRHRPWIVLVEATLPLTQVASHVAWEPTLLGAGYVLAYADGLNRFYVASEHSDRASRLAVPPNVFDDYKTIQLLTTEQERDQARRAATEAEAARQAAEGASAAHAESARKATTELELVRTTSARQIAYLTGTVAELEARLARTSSELAAVYGSRSWRLSYPLRLASLLARDRRAAVPTVRLAARQAAREAARTLARSASRLLKRAPGLRAHAQDWLRARPALAHRVHRLLAGGLPAPEAAGAQYRESRSHSPSVAELPKGAREVYLALREALDRDRKD